MVDQGGGDVVRVAGTPMGAGAVAGVVVVATCTSCGRRVWIDASREAWATVAGVECLWCFVDVQMTGTGGLDARTMAMIDAAVRQAEEELAAEAAAPSLRGCTKSACSRCGRLVWVSDSLVGVVDLSALVCPACDGAR